MKYYTAEYNQDWADEFDLTARALFNETEYNMYIESLKDTVYISGYFGNLDACNKHTKEEFLERVVLTEITKEDFKVLQKHDYLSGNCSAFD